MAERETRRQSAASRATSASNVDGWRFVAGTPHTSQAPGTAFTASGRKRADRARQFLPFAALRGYYELIRQQERVPEPKRELPEEDALRLSELVARLCKGDLVRITHYDEDAYITTEGVVTRIDTAFKTLDVVKRRIDFDAILDIEPLTAPNGQPSGAGERSKDDPK